MDLETTDGWTIARHMGGQTGRKPTLLYIDSETRATETMEKFQLNSAFLLDWIETSYKEDLKVR